MSLKIDTKYNNLYLLQDEEAAKKFRAITEAYEVLGNARLKKLYDKGYYNV